MVPTSSVVHSGAIQDTRAGVASWRWSSGMSGAPASWPIHQAGQLAVGGVLFSSAWSAGVAISLPFLALQCAMALSGDSEAEYGRRREGDGLRENECSETCRRTISKSAAG